MQRPWNCNIYTKRPPTGQRSARLAWDFFMWAHPLRKPSRMWFTRDTVPFSAWVMEWDDIDDTYSEIISQSLQTWAHAKANPGEGGVRLVPGGEFVVEYLDAAGQALGRDYHDHEDKARRVLDHPQMMYWAWHEASLRAPERQGKVPARFRVLGREGEELTQKSYDSTWMPKKIPHWSDEK